MLNATEKAEFDVLDGMNPAKLDATQQARLTELTVKNVAPADNAGVDVFAALRKEMSSTAGFVAAQQGKRGGVQPLAYGEWNSTIDGETGLPALIGLDKKTGKGEEREYEKQKYNVALYFALTGGPAGASGSGRVSQQMIADFPQLIVETAGQPIAVKGTFGITVKTVDGRRVGTLHTDKDAYDSAVKASVKA